MKTRQELFNTAYNGLKSQKFMKSIKGPICRYRDDNGRKCAIGWCIPDDKYDITFDEPVDASINISIQTRPDIREAAGISWENVEFARQLQMRHDQAMSPEHMKKMLIEFAKSYELEVPNDE